MDVFAIEAFLDESRDRLTGARIDKIHQPLPELVVFRLWTGRENLRLLVEVSPQRSRLHLTEEVFPNPRAPARFCQLLRSRLGRLESLEQILDERVVGLDFRSRTGASCRLWVELLGAHGNLVLVDEGGRVIDALKRSSSGKREIRPGAVYRLPEAPERPTLREGLPDLSRAPEESRSFAAWLSEAIRPMSPAMAADLAAGLKIGRSPEEVLDEFRRRWLGRQWRPVSGELGGRPVFFALAPEFLNLENPRSYPDVVSGLEAFYRTSAEGGPDGGHRPRLEKAVRRERKRLQGRLRKIAADRERMADFQRPRQLAELLLASLHRLTRGMKEVTVEDFYRQPPEPVTIPLDPRLTPQENAEGYFRIARKRRRGGEHVARRQRETERELEWVEGVAQALAEAEDPGSLQEIREELEEQKVLAPEASRRRPAEGKGDFRQRLHSCHTPDGFRLYWGRNNRTNDYVSRELTAADDLWFHAHRVPGCHLVLKTAGKKAAVSATDIMFAAALAAGYSRARDDTRVEVMVAEGRAVSKPKGARPGLVTVEEYRTVNVVPQRLETRER